MKKFLTIINSILLFGSCISYSYAVVSTPSPAASNILNQMSSSMSHSVINSSNITNNSQNVTSNLINSTNLKQDIKENAEKLDLKVDEGALSVLSNVSSDSKEIAKAMEKMADNIEEKDYDYVMTLDQNVVVYDSGWFNLERVQTGSNGLTYNKPATSDVFADAVQEGRGRVYVNFNKKEMSADMYTRITLKGASQVQHEWNTGTAGITSLPVVASTVRGLKSDGSTDFDEFVGINSSMQIGSDELAANYDPGYTKQQLMDWYNHDTNNGDADKRLFFYGKFTTIDSSGSTGTGTIVIEGAHDQNADATNATTTATYIGTIERLEGTATIVGKALE